MYRNPRELVDIRELCERDMLKSAKKLTVEEVEKKEGFITEYNQFGEKCGQYSLHSLPTEIPMYKEPLGILQLDVFEGGYMLKSGKKLTVEDVRIIGKEAGLDTDTGVERKKGWVTEYDEDGEICGGYLKHFNPLYQAYISIKKPLPPMLIFLSSDCANYAATRSAYTINLNTLQPTRNSPIQKAIPEYIEAKLQ